MPGFIGLNRNTSSSKRGYGYQHKKTRAAAFAQLPEWSPCARCGKPMWKWAKDKHGKSNLHWDHNDRRDGYLGFSHGSTCNVKAGAAKGGHIALTKRRQGSPRSPRATRPWRSRTW